MFIYLTWGKRGRIQSTGSSSNQSSHNLRRAWYTVCRDLPFVLLCQRRCSVMDEVRDWEGEPNKVEDVGSFFYPNIKTRALLQIQVLPHHHTPAVPWQTRAMVAANVICAADKVHWRHRCCGVALRDDAFKDDADVCGWSDLKAAFRNI